MNQLVSIIVPLYNAEKWIDRGVACLLGQTYQSIEVLLVDDASTDHSEVLCRGWEKKDARIRYYRMEQNGGAGPTRNFGMAHASGDYITFFDIDDLCNAQMIEDNLHLAVTKNADITMWNLKKITAEEEIGPPERDPSAFASADKAEIRDRWLELRFSPKPMALGSPCNKLYRKAFLEEHHLQFPNTRRMQDTIFNLYCMRHVRRLAVTQTEYYYYFFNTAGVFWKKIKPDFYENVIAYGKAFESLLEEWGVTDPFVDEKVDEDFFGTLYSAVEACKNPKWKWTARKRIQYVREIVEHPYVQQRAKKQRVRQGEFVRFAAFMKKKAVWRTYFYVACRPGYYQLRRFFGKMLRKLGRK